MALIKQSEFADLCGVKRQAVHKWKQEGKLVMTGALVDVDASLALLGRVRKGGSPAKETLAAEKTIEIDLKPGESLDDAAARLVGDIDVNTTSFDEARRIKEVYLALLNRLDYAKKSGAVVELAMAENILFECARAQRDSWLSWPSRISPLLAAELGIDEADRVTEFLTAHVHKQVAKLGIPDADFINTTN
jgi:hypothetical protein